MATLGTVKVLTNDFATGEEFEIIDASPGEIAELLPRFDGQAVDNMLFEIQVEGDVVEIGLTDGRSGWASMYVADRAGTRYLCARNPPPLDQRQFVMTICGRTETDQCAHWVVPTTDAVDALWYFLHTGERDPARIWERFDPATFDPPGPTQPWPDAPPPFEPPSRAPRSTPG